MLALFGTLKAKLIAILGGFVALGLGIWYVFNRGRRSKEVEVQAETAKTIIKTAKEVRKNEERVNNLSDDELDKQLLKDSRNPR